MELADRIVYLEKGQIRKIYTPEEFRKLPEAEREHMGLRAVDLTRYFLHRSACLFQHPYLNFKM